MIFKLLPINVSSLIIVTNFFAFNLFPGATGHSHRYGLYLNFKIHLSWVLQSDQKTYHNFLFYFTLSLLETNLIQTLIQSTQPWVCHSKTLCQYQLDHMIKIVHLNYWDNRQLYIFTLPFCHWIQLTKNRWYVY